MKITLEKCKIKLICIIEEESLLDPLKFGMKKVNQITKLIYLYLIIVRHENRVVIK